MQSGICLLIACLFFFDFQGRAQNLKGKWDGIFIRIGVRDKVQLRDTFKFSIIIATNKDKLSCTTYTSLNTGVFFAKAGAKVKVDSTTHTVVIKEKEIISFNSKYNAGVNACLMSCKLNYRKSVNSEELQGTFTSIYQEFGNDCGSGEVYLKKTK